VKGFAVARLAVQLAGDERSSLERKVARLQFGAGKVAPAAFDEPGFIDRFDANSFLYLTRALDHFDLAADFGGQLSNAFKDIATRICVFAASSDWRYPPSEARAIVRGLIAAGAEASYVEAETEKGHTAFFSEEPAFEAALTGFIDAAAAARELALRGDE
jgi:homoserine O-acetyltransferase